MKTLEKNRQMPVKAYEFLELISIFGQVVYPISPKDSTVHTKKEKELSKIYLKHFVLISINK